MTWFALYDEATGRIRSVGQVVADPLPAGLGVLEFTERPADSQMWDEATRSFVARPPKVLIDRLQELVDDPVLGAVWQRLTTPQRQALRDRLVRLLGTRRFRNVSEGTDLDG